MIRVFSGLNAIWHSTFWAAQVAPVPAGLELLHDLRQLAVRARRIDQLRPIFVPRRRQLGHALAHGGRPGLGRRGRSIARLSGRVSGAPRRLHVSAWRWCGQFCYFVIFFLDMRSLLPKSVRRTLSHAAICLAAAPASAAAGATCPACLSRSLGPPERGYLRHDTRNAEECMASALHPAHGAAFGALWRCPAPDCEVYDSVPGTQSARVTELLAHCALRHGSLPKREAHSAGEGLAPRQRGAQQAQRLACPSWALQQRILALPPAYIGVRKFRA